MKKLYLVEKKTVAEAIADYLWPEGYTKSTHSFSKDDVQITWTIGHILGQCLPEEINADWRPWTVYPVLPKEHEWLLKPISARKVHYDHVVKMIEATQEIIHCGDGDREGQTLIDELLKECNYRGPVQRMLPNALDKKSLQKAFAEMTGNEKFHDLYLAGVARARADWLVSMNCGRCYTTRTKIFGWNETWRIGRVKTPTLALVVNREKERLQFKSYKYYELKGIFKYQDVSFSTRYQPKQNIPINKDNRIIDKNILSLLKNKLITSEAQLENVESKLCSSAPPLPYSLAKLQIEANGKFGYSPKTVLESLEKLYLAKLISYPRGDNRYLPTNQLETAPEILQSLAIFGFAEALAADVSLRSLAWDDKKITAHHAIIPTVSNPKNMDSKAKVLFKDSNQELDEISANLYRMITQRFILQFYPNYEYKQVKFCVRLGDENFIGTGKQPLNLGYKAVFKNDMEEHSKEEENTLLPQNMASGDNVQVTRLEIMEKDTKAAKRFTEGTLLAAMENVWKFLEPSDQDVEMLKKTKGIGTPATRDTIISDLQASESHGRPITPYLQKNSKGELEPTAVGTAIVENIDPVLISPKLTSKLECDLAKIIDGENTLSGCLDEAISLVMHSIAFAESHIFPEQPGKVWFDCPLCHGEIIRHKAKNSNRFFHLCSNDKCVSPYTGKKVFYDDNNGSPMIETCPNCGNVLSRIYYSAKNIYFWACRNEECKKTYSEKKCHPVFK